MVDEAYGDFMDNANSAVTLINDYDNVAVIRTFKRPGAGRYQSYLVGSKADEILQQDIQLIP